MKVLDSLGQLKEVYTYPVPASGTVDPGTCELRLSLSSVDAVTTNDIIFTSTSSGRITSGTSTLFIGSGVVSGICPGMIVTGSGIPVGTFVTSLSGSTGVGINTVTTQAASGTLVEFIPGAVYAMPYDGNRVSLYNTSSGWVNYGWISGANSRVLLYDNRHTPILRSGDAAISGLLDTFQLIPGMLAVMSGNIASGTVISTVDGASNVTLSATAASGTPGGSGSILFMMPPTSGAVSSGANWDLFATVRSGAPWLQLGSQWISGSTRLDLLKQQDGVEVNSGGIF